MSDASPSSRNTHTAFFDSRLSARWAADSYGPKEQKNIDRLLRATGPLTGLRLLEPGCGTGRLTDVLAENVGPTGCIIAMDISPQMVAAARQRLSCYDNVKIYLGAAEARARSLGYFDQIICHQVFPHFLDRAHALKSLSDTLNPYGLIVISHFHSVANVTDIRGRAGQAVSGKMLPGKDKMQDLCKECGLEIENWWNDQEMYLLSARLI
jgi:demethylmenaquinone methyltransferase/2-methoxy-6-polyprenyl-1,4-benzoquinol methylase